MSYTVETICPDIANREDLLDFLVHSPGEIHPESRWRERMRFWWDDNPAADAGQPWGWALRHNNRVVGFLGCVPVMYQFQGSPVPAVAASTWRVMEKHRGQSLRLFMPLFKLSREMPVLNTSPSPAVMQVLERSGFQSRRACTRHFFAMGAWVGPLAASLAGRGRGFPRLAGDLRVVTDVAAVQSVARPVMRDDRLEKRISPEYLRWLLSTPMASLQFAGCIDESGTLTSFLILIPDVFKGVRSWLTVDWFTTRDTMDELLALTGELCRHPRILPGGAGVRLLAAVSFEGDDGWLDAPALHRRETPARHFYGLPATLKNVPKRCVPAEGDFLL